MKTSVKEPFCFTKTKSNFEITLEKSISSFGEKTLLRDACEYALMNGGKRIRPLIVYMIAEALNCDKDVSTIALSIEYFHTASLIVDDLPCMDNDDFRREKPSVHKVFGEAVAVLASYALMTAGFEKIHESCSKLSQEKGEACLTTLYEVCRASGIHGATGGQFLDLYPHEDSLSHLLMVIEKKTVKLFEIAFLYGWIFGGGDFRFIEEIKKLGFHFGMAFQIADDLADSQEDQKKEKLLNIGLYLGSAKAKAFFMKELHLFDELAQKLNLKTASFDKLIQKLVEHAKR